MSNTRPKSDKQVAKTATIGAGVQCVRARLRWRTSGISMAGDLERNPELRRSQLHWHAP